MNGSRNGLYEGPQQLLLCDVLQSYWTFCDVALTPLLLSSVLLYPDVSCLCWLCAVFNGDPIMFVRC